MEPPLEVQPPTHAVKSLVHELVELMGCGHQMNPTAKVSRAHAKCNQISHRNVESVTL